MNNSENGFNTFSNGTEQPTNPEQTRQPSLQEIKELGSSALAGYDPNEIFVEYQAQVAPEVQETQEIQEVQEVQETPISVTPDIPDTKLSQPEEITSVISELVGVEWHQPLTENTKPVAEITSDNNGTETAHENLTRKLLEKAKGSRAFKAMIAAGLAATIALSLAACGADKDANQAPDQSGSELVDRVENTALSGEQPNGVVYDYSHYADREGKESANAYDYDISDCYGDEEAFKNRFMGVASSTPEALSTYTIIFTDEERQELGLGESNVVSVDNAISNDASGGDLQKKLLNKLDKVLNDKENTRFTFYLENNYETSSYMYFVDQNNDGTMTPVEMHIGKAYSKRNGAPQVDIERKIVTANGTTEWVKKADINLRCGGQINGRAEDFPDIPVIDPNNPNPTPETPTIPPTEKPTEWGKEGDPHGGPDVTPSDKVDPNSEVSKEQNDDTNKGNQGYVDDNQATPGSSSDNNGSYNEDRLSGGENQGGDQTNGTNTYNNPEQNNQGQQVDNSGNESQQQAQDAGVKPGEDNYSDAEEENPDNW